MIFWGCFELFSQNCNIGCSGSAFSAGEKIIHLATTELIVDICVGKMEGLEKWRGLDWTSWCIVALVYLVC